MKKTRNNVTFSIGSVAIVDKVNALFKLFDGLFGKGFGKARTVKETAKALVCNRLDKCASINRLNEFYPLEFFELLGFKENPAERSLYRDVERIGMRFSALLEKYQELAKKHGWVSAEQFVDFSSTYFEGKKNELGALGYSRDGQPGKRQIVFGISTGINGVPSAITVQKGNTQDKKHFGVMLKTVAKVLDEGSLLIFDCGGNTKANKMRVLELGFNYLTLKAKKRCVYKQFILSFKRGEQRKIKVGESVYYCVKAKHEQEVNYVFFSEKLKHEQLEKKHKKFLRELNKNDRTLTKVKKGKDIGTMISKAGYIVTRGLLQPVFGKMPNPYITGLEGFFILESSIDAEPEKILHLYKKRDKAEKLIRNMKEGTELRPIRHWSKWAVLGYLFIVFLTNAVTSLTLLLTPNSLVKNTKLLKKYLENLTLTVVYPKKAFQVRLLSNITPPIDAILGDFIHRYGAKSIDLRW